MSFLIDINPEMELPKYKLTLCRLNEEPIASLKNITGLKMSPLFVGIDNMTFNVPLNIMSSDGVNSRNEVYDMVEGDHLVKLNDMSYFIIVSVKEIADSDGRKYKEVQCKSREYGLIDRKLVDYRANSRVLYDFDDDMLDGLEKGILNYIFKYLIKSWTRGYIDPDLVLREGKGISRALSFDNSNLIQVFMELQKTFNCIFTFDSIKREINVHDVKNMTGQNRGLYISDTNFIKNITKDVNSEGIITRLYLRGKDGVSIQSISPTGQPYLDNFDYYKNTKYMSQGLIDALDSYSTKTDEYNPDFKPLFTLLSDANTFMEELLNKDSLKLEEKGLVALGVKLNQIQTLIDVKVEELGLIQKTINSAEGSSLAGLHATKKDIQAAMDAFIVERTEVNILIEAKEEQIDLQQLVIDGIEEDIKVLQHDLDSSNTDNFTDEQLKELDDFVKVETFSDTNYTEHNLDELKEEGIRQLSRLSQPPIQFNVDVVDFLSIIEGQNIWPSFILGDIVTLEHKEMGIKFTVRLVGYEHDVDGNNLNLKFSNTNSYDDATLYERDLVEYIGNVGTTVDFNADKWNDVGQVEGRLAKLVDFKLEEARKNILNAVGQQHLFDDSGLWLYKENPDGRIDGAQIRGINSDIALTDDNWKTVKTAISARDGINAELIRGKLGQFAHIQAHQIVVGDFGQKLSDDLIDVNLEGLVRQDELYNQVVITKEKGLQVLDMASRERVRLGNYKKGKYGLSIKDKSGSTTVLDEDGILQTWQEGNTDNVDLGKPLNLYIYIPEQTNIIHKAILRFKLEKFRAYSTSTISGGQFTESTADGGGFTESTADGGQFTESTADGGSFTESTLGGGGTTTDTGPGGINVEWVYPRTTHDDGHSHEYKRVHSHQHAVTIKAHTHYMNMPDHKHGIDIPKHSHGIDIPAHSHGIDIPPHNHDIEYGIYESSYPKDVTIKINGTDYSSYLGADNGVFNRDEDNIDITSLLEIGKWNTISLGSSILGRIESTVFLQAFINTSRKSVILDDNYIVNNLLESTIGVGEVAVTAKRSHIASGIDHLFRMSVIRGEANVHSLDWTKQEQGWRSEFSVGNASSVALSMDGEWQYNEFENNYGFRTGDKPHLFWVDNGILYTQHWNDVASKRQLSSNVVKVNAIRGWKNVSFVERDQGVIAGYVKTDGKVYYRNYCALAGGGSSWESEKQVKEFTGTARNLNLCITNDYRVGFTIEDNLGKIHWILSERNWGGMATPPHTISVAPVQVIGNLIPLEYLNRANTEHLSVAPAEVSGEMLFASVKNEVVGIANTPVIMLDKNNEEYTDWGWEIEFEVKNPIPSLTLQQVSFASVETGVPIGMASIKSIGESRYRATVDNTIDVGMNNVFGDIKITITNAVNPAGINYSVMTKDFTPINLVPEFIPLPVVDSIWNE